MDGQPASAAMSIGSGAEGSKLREAAIDDEEYEWGESFRGSSYSQRREQVGYPRDCIQHGIGHQRKLVSRGSWGGVAEQRKLTLDNTGMRTGAGYVDVYLITCDWDNHACRKHCLIKLILICFF